MLGQVPLIMVSEICAGCHPEVPSKLVEQAHAVTVVGQRLLAPLENRLQRHQHITEGLCEGKRPGHGLLRRGWKGLSVVPIIVLQVVEQGRDLFKPWRNPIELTETVLVSADQENHRLPTRQGLCKIAFAELRDQLLDHAGEILQNCRGARILPKKSRHAGYANQLLQLRPRRVCWRQQGIHICLPRFSVVFVFFLLLLVLVLVLLLLFILLLLVLLFFVLHLFLGRLRTLHHVVFGITSQAPKLVCPHQGSDDGRQFLCRHPHQSLANSSRRLLASRLLRGIDLDVMPEGGQELIHIFLGIRF
mmetsp:Transcript_137665/g.326107  ORF Transcript_137665/g.326107 Transcript_137665/m.326107 type:complete len:304 (+) Transcript_137665:299-1210(+)